MSKITELTSLDDLDDMLAASATAAVVLLKHSAACPVSAIARGHFDRLSEDDEVQPFLVVVQRARDVSNAVADKLAVRHETPQAIVIRDGKAVYVANHYRVSADDLKKHVMPSNGSETA